MQMTCTTRVLSTPHWIEGTRLPDLYNELCCSILNKVRGQQNKIPTD